MKHLLTLLFIGFAYNAFSQPPLQEKVRVYVHEFNQADNETVINAIPNSQAADWLLQNVPLFDCPDTLLLQTYYFRWWVYRKHLRQTPSGFVITEFLPNVPWAGAFNTISCPAGHHFYEGRWIRDARYLTDYSRFWLSDKGEPRRYSFWFADAVEQFLRIHPQPNLRAELLPGLLANYTAWQQNHQDSTGLYWQIDDRDGMEKSIGGSGYRTTINSYQYADARALARLFREQNQPKQAAQLNNQARRLRTHMFRKLWDRQSGFFKVLPRTPGATLQPVRELHGYVPWYANMARKRHAKAWQWLSDSTGFAAPYGPTSAERQHPAFMADDPHECLWNGPSWPFATTQTLVALANFLRQSPRSRYANRGLYWSLFQTYTRSHSARRPDGNPLPWIDENLDPFTGEWIARTKLHALNRPDKDRGKDYNHSAFADLLITGLIGLQPRSDNRLVIDPLLPADQWSYFRLTNIPYRGKLLTIEYDRDGSRYKQGIGLSVWADGQLLGRRATLERINVWF